jgi:hypothetical protein
MPENISFDYIWEVNGERGENFSLQSRRGAGDGVKSKDGPMELEIPRDRNGRPALILRNL